MDTDDLQVTAELGLRRPDGDADRAELGESDVDELREPAEGNHAEGAAAADPALDDSHHSNASDDDTIERSGDSADTRTGTATDTRARVEVDPEAGTVADTDVDSGSATATAAGGPDVTEAQADAPATGATGPGAVDLPVRPPRSRKVGRRRAVDPLIGDQLAAELLSGHRQDVLLSERCSCGQPFPCRSRAFATCFVLDKAYPPADLEMPYQIVPPELRAPRSPRHAAPTTAPAPVVAAPVVVAEPDQPGVTSSRAERRTTSDEAGSAEDSRSATELPVDLDATVQFAKVAVDPPVAVAS